METSNKLHWDTVYETKNPDQVSWTQEVPTISLSLIQSLGLSKTAKIIDVGGGDSKLVDCLLADGFENITVLDISQKALEKSQKRLGSKADKVQWIVSDITNFQPNGSYDLWHDRAAFHFLTNPNQIANYVATVNQHVNGYLVLATFSENGPIKCSGLEIKQYSEASMTHEFEHNFDKIQCTTTVHVTPFDTTQDFLFCSFKRKDNSDLK